MSLIVSYYLGNELLETIVAVMVRFFFFFFS